MTPTLSLGIRPDAVAAWINLAYAIRHLEDGGSPPVCQSDPDAWMSESRHTRAEAAEACRLSRCPALPLCDRFATANREKYGVWAGVDRRKTP